MIIQFMRNILGKNSTIIFKWETEIHAYQYFFEEIKKLNIGQKLAV